MDLKCYQAAELLFIYYVQLKEKDNTFASKHISVYKCKINLHWSASYMHVYRHTAITCLELTVLCYDLLKCSQNFSPALMNSRGVGGRLYNVCAPGA